MTTRACGAFDVKLVPQAADDQTGDAPLGRMLIDKQFHGDLEAASHGQMLAAQTGVKGSAGCDGTGERNARWPHWHVHTPA
jgi:hypothetical protein